MREIACDARNGAEHYDRELNRGEFSPAKQSSRNRFTNVPVCGEGESPHCVSEIRDEDSGLGQNRQRKV
jgi:hypothetical protein